MYLFCNSIKLYYVEQELEDGIYSNYKKFKVFSPDDGWYLCLFVENGAYYITKISVNNYNKLLFDYENINIHEYDKAFVSIAVYPTEFVSYIETEGIDTYEIPDRPEPEPAPDPEPDPEPTPDPDPEPDDVIPDNENGDDEDFGDLDDETTT